jgi:polysaccharide deacetylase family protein (PEP-CTERM system associated)
VRHVTLAPAAASQRRHLLTVDLEEYFQVDAFAAPVDPAHWYRFESRLEVGLEATLQLLGDLSGCKATFFVLGWIAERYPELVRRIAEQGHEVASAGYERRRLDDFTPQQLRDDLARTREALERAGRHRIHGYRGIGGIAGHNAWALDALADAGYSYDSSERPPTGFARRGGARRYVHAHRTHDRTIWEFPISTLSVAGWHVPAVTGGALRRLPASWAERAVRNWERESEAPLVVSFRTWELDPEQPRLQHAPASARRRHYRQLDRAREHLTQLLTPHRFTSIAEWAGLSSVDRRHAVRAAQLLVPASGITPTSVPVVAAVQRLPVTVVIPCHNEAPAVRYLGNTLSSVEWSLSPRYDLRFLFVDDGSTDGTHAALQLLTASHRNYRVLKLQVNAGVTGAILAGIRAAETEVVASMDCDCTYDPHELGQMIPMLGEDVAVVTASPYHPNGSVHGVARWRLIASRSLSWLYRRILARKLYTYTSCFRVYRRSAVAQLALQHGDFLGMAEMVARLDEGGSGMAARQVREHPSTLSRRVFGESKMRTVRVALAHLRLLVSLAGRRLLPRSPRRARTAAEGAVHA